MALRVGRKKCTQTENTSSNVDNLDSVSLCVSVGTTNEGENCYRNGAEVTLCASQAPPMDVVGTSKVDCFGGSGRRIRYTESTSLLEP